MAPKSKLNAPDYAEAAARDCLDTLLLELSPPEFGNRMQAVAAHILLRLGYYIEAVNRTGHPDIIAWREGLEYRFEVEAQVTGPRPRQLETADFAALLNTPNAQGYYALAVSPTRRPRWLLVPAARLVNRQLPSPNALLEALSDRDYSAAWTAEYHRLLQQSGRIIRQTPSSELGQRAVEGKRL